MRSRRPSKQTIAVVLALGHRSTTWRYGYELGKRLDLKAGSLYPILQRLADRGMLEAEWEQEPPLGRPPRHLYRLTASGLALCVELTARPRPQRRVRSSRDHEEKVV